MKSNMESKVNRLISIGILLVLGFWIPSHFSFTRTRSLDHRLFYITSPNREAAPGKDSYVMFRHDNPMIADLIRETRTDRIIKKVVCAGGDHLKVVHREFYCDGQMLGRAVERTPSGASIGHFEYDGIISQNKLFVMGSSPDSYDSRYFGFVDRQSVIALAYPVL